MPSPDPGAQPHAARPATAWPGRRLMTAWPPALPGRCGVCLEWVRGGGVCAACLQRFAPAVRRCRRCALPVPAPLVCCGRCLVDAPPQARTVAAFDYAFPWDRAIAELKFRQGLGWAVPLARALGRAVVADAATAEEDTHTGDDAGRGSERGGRPTLVVPVPLAASRLTARGYNQAWELARRLARSLRLQARHDALLRLRDTPAQVTLDRAARAANLRGAFMPGPRAARQAVQGHVVALVDDVLTTGATAAAAVAALREAGAREVHVWVLARTAARVPD